ncbi:Isochorismatase family protein YecD [Thalassoglobus neptunius]|uniref:Isochorismatase family protein YecD n=1 Tax=Thalassoglobus neptunius TaxID=1938619 RepID=A0A5C5X5Z3_9PLAN|nr:cysteine hydrolase [Thalassoglobus neptunius]TWT57673.1 Isochorismatase family protein YecD [Thalassoglobus neptunius]
MSTTKRNSALVLGLVTTFSIVGVYSLSGGSKSSAAANKVATHKTPEPVARNLDTQVKLSTSTDLGIPRPGMVLEAGRTAIVITDPQNDFLSPDGVAWGVVGESVTENGTVDNIHALFETARDLNLPVFVSPHYYYPHDHQWKFEGALESLMHNINMFDRKGELSCDHFHGSGADWLEQYKPYIEGDNVIVTSPHKVYGPESNDLVLQLRKRGIEKIILAGMSANLCTESHMRELIEQGFEVTVVQDATAGAKTPAGDSHKVAVANYHYIASAVVTTEEALEGLRKAFVGSSSK